jgi:glycosyltransferase involved in cell wall biosynthesis
MMIRIFTPSFLDEDNTNGQNLTVKEVASRLDPGRFHLTAIASGKPDPRISKRHNTDLLRWRNHGNAMRILLRCLWQRPDIYWFPRESFLDAGFLLLRRTLRLKTKLVTYIVKTLDHGQEEDRSSLAARTLSAIISEADAVVGNSRYVTETIQTAYGMSGTTVYDGIDHRYFFPNDQETLFRKPARERLTVIYVGSFQARKRPDVVIRQAAKWPSVKFKLAGVGEEMPSCQALVERLGCSNVFFLGRLSQEKIGEEMRDADVFLFPSVIEGHPQVLLQAAACGLPCIAMSLYHPDYVVNGETGFLVDNDEELTEKLDLLLSNPDLRFSMSQSAVRHIQQYDWDFITRKWQEIFETVAIRSRAFGNLTHPIGSSDMDPVKGEVISRPVFEKRDLRT